VSCCRRITTTIEGEAVVEPPSIVGIAVLLASVVDVDEIAGLELEFPH
jgi:hypothetical protein